jgi:GPI mannosyltransferase 2
MSYANCEDLKEIGFQKHEFLESIVGISLAHAAHGLSVLALYSLTRAIFHSGRDKKLAFITASLHVFSPAGLFLSAPYGESTFALLSFTGYLLFVNSFNFTGRATTQQDVLMVASGVVLGSATTVRSNGLLNGMLFLEEASRIIYSLKFAPGLPGLRRLIATGIGGLCIAFGFAVPQLIAFQEICRNNTQALQLQRSWCKDKLPSVYGFVQNHYWYVEQFRGDCGEMFV